MNDDQIQIQNEILEGLGRNQPTRNSFTREMSDRVADILVRYKHIQTAERIPYLVNDNTDSDNVNVITIMGNYVTADHEILFTNEDLKEMFEQSGQLKTKFSDSLYREIQTMFPNVIKTESYYNPHPLAENLMSKFLGFDFLADDYYDLKDKILDEDVEDFAAGELDNEPTYAVRIGSERVSYRGNNGEIVMYYGIPRQAPKQIKTKNSTHYFGKLYMLHYIDDELQAIYPFAGQRTFNNRTNEWKPSKNTADFIVRALKENKITDFKMDVRKEQQNKRLV